MFTPSSLFGFTKEIAFAKGQVVFGDGLIVFFFPLGDQALAGQLRYHCLEIPLNLRYYLFPFVLP